MVSPRTKFVSELARAKAFLVRGDTISFQWESATPVPSYLPRPFQSPKIQIIPDCSGWSLASQTLHRQIWKFRGRRPLPVSACPRRHQSAVANTLRRRTVRQHGLPKRCKPGKGAGSLRGGFGTVLRVLGLVGSQPSLLE